MRPGCSWLERQTRHEWEQSWRERWGDCCRDELVRHRRMFRGDTLQFIVQVLSPVPGVPGDNPPLVPLDITSYTMWCTGKYTLPDVDQQAVFQLESPSSGIIFPTPTAGMAQITVPPSVTLPFPDSDVCIVYDVQVRSSTGVVSTVEFGFIDVWPDVTRTISP